VRVVSSETKLDAVTPGKVVLEVRFVDEISKHPITPGRVIVEPFYGPNLDVDLNNDGAALIEAEPGSYTLRSSCPGYIDWSDDVEVPSRPGYIEKTVELGRLILVRGIVRNAKRQPQAGANITFFQDGSSSTINSGSGGRFETILVAHDIQKLYAFKPPHPIAEMGPITLDEAHNPYLEITLPPEAAVVRLSGRILDDQGKPVAGAAVSVRPEHLYDVSNDRHDIIIRMAQISYYINSIKSDSEGHFSLEILPQRNVPLRVNARNLEGYSETLDLTKDVEKSIYLKRHPMFRVTVQDADGRQVSGMDVIGESPDGRNVVSSTSEVGKYFATAYPFRIFADGIKKNLGISTSQWVGTYRGEIVLVLGQGHLAGRVIDESGNPVRFLTITVKTAGDNSYHRSSGFDFYSEDGSFELQNIIPGKASISISAGSPRLRESLEPFEQDLLVEEGRTAHLRAVLNRK
jgi:hypothetical protein